MIKNVSVCGAGIMGTGIAQVAATNGYKVTLYDVDKNSLSKSISAIESSLSKLSTRNNWNDTTVGDIKRRLKTTNDLKETAEKADLIIEAIVENPDIKINLFSSLDKMAPPQCIFVSNTSSLVVGELARLINRKERFGGLHFFNPVPLMKLVEVVDIGGQSPETIKALVEFVESLGKTAIVCKDKPGFIVNRLLVPYLKEAIDLLDNGVASKENIDLAMKLGAGYPMGPFQLLDAVGLDTVKHILDGWHANEPENTVFRPSKTLNDLVQEGRLGRKAGRGFYDYE